MGQNSRYLPANKQNSKYLIQLLSILFVFTGIFSIVKDDLTSGLSMIAMGYLALGFLIEDKRSKNIHIISSIIIFVLIQILDNFYLKI